MKGQINELEEMFPKDTLNDESREIINKIILEKSGIKDLINIIEVQQPMNVVSYLDFEGEFNNDKIDLSSALEYPKSNAKFSTVTIKPFEEVIAVKSYQSSTSCTMEQMNELKRDHGIDMNIMLQNVLIEEAARSIGKHFIDKVKKLAKENATIIKLTWYEKIQKLFFNIINKILGTSYDLKPKYDFITDPNLSPKENLMRLHGKILYNGNIIMQDGRRGPANAIITNVRLGTIIQNMSVFENIDKEFNKKQNVGTLYPIGNFCGLTVFIDPYMSFNEDDIYIFRVNKKEEPGLVMTFYGKGTTMYNSVDESTMANKLSLGNRYAIETIGNKPYVNYRKISCKIDNNLML